MTETHSKQPVSYSRAGNIAVIEIYNPPVNALGTAVREGLVSALDRAAADSAVEAVILTGAGGSFSAGADITEFGQPARAPLLGEVNRRCEAMDKPVIAAISGVAFGGGLELALACHARVASSEVRVGLPEVRLGLIPGAGGTQRLPRIAGVRAALDIIVSGEPVDIARALSIGIVERIVEGDCVAGAMVLARELARSARLPLSARDRDDLLATDRRDIAAIEAYAARLLGRTRGLMAPRAAAKAIRLALELPFDEGLKRERALFEDLLKGEESKALRHLFFAERMAAKPTGLGRDARPRKIERVAVIGAGTMGGGIAMAFANKGYAVSILERDAEALERGLSTIATNYDRSVRGGSISSEERDRRLARLKRAANYRELGEADLIIEAVHEDMDVKRQVFAELDRIAGYGAVLATNTSYLDIDEIARATERPGDVLGMHFFSPANVMRLIEIVRGEKTAPEVLATALAVAKAIGKVPVVVGVCHGFVGNRMLSVRSSELESLLLEGARPEEIDEALTGFGFPMGPFAMSDLAGLDIGWSNRKSLGRAAVIADALCEAGRFGQKTGRGFYLYPDGARRPTTDPELSELIESKAREMGIERREIATEEIIERTIYPMVNEGARILDEKIAERPSDIDLIWVHGYGFPAGKGGPMFWAEREGAGRIAERLRHWFERTGNPVFEPAGVFADPALAR